MARQQIDHHAVVGRVEVLYDDEGHAVDRRKRVQEFSARVEAAGRGADRDDWKIAIAARGKRTLKRTGSIRLVMPRHDFQAFCNFSRRTPFLRTGQQLIAEYRANCELFRRGQIPPGRVITNPTMV